MTICIKKQSSSGITKHQAAMFSSPGYRIFIPRMSALHCHNSSYPKHTMAILICTPDIFKSGQRFDQFHKGDASMISLPDTMLSPHRFRQCPTVFWETSRINAPVIFPVKILSVRPSGDTQQPVRQGSVYMLPPPFQRQFKGILRICWMVTVRSPCRKFTFYLHKPKPPALFSTIEYFALQEEVYTIFKLSAWP